MGSKAGSILGRITVVAALVVPVGWAVVAPAVSAKTAKIPKPKVTAFTAVPSVVTPTSGPVQLSVTTTGASSCTFTTTASGDSFVPSATSACPSGAPTVDLVVARNTGRKPVKAHVVLTATGAGGTKAAKLVVTVEPGAGGSSVPGAPTAVTAVASDGAAAVSFAPPASNGGQTVTSYTVTAVDLTSPSRGGETTPGGASPLTVSGLTDGDTYDFTATATNVIGTGAVSTASNQVVPASVPGAPTAVTAVASDGAAAVSFAPPASNGGQSVTSYTVTAVDLSSSSRGGETTPGGASPLTVSGLTDGDTYDFTVTARNVVGAGPASSASNPVVPAKPLGTPTDVMAVPGDGEATVTFTAPADAPPSAGYVVTAADRTTPGNGSQGGTGTSPVTVSGLVDGDTYTFTVTMEVSGVDGPTSPPSNTVVPAGGLEGLADQAVVSGTSTLQRALDANPDLATCTSASSPSGTCVGLQYGVWAAVPGSDQEYYAFGNPQPDFDPVTHALDDLRVQVVGAASDPADQGSYVFEQETATIGADDQLLQNVWWSNYESYNPEGDYSHCDHNWSGGLNYDIDSLFEAGTVTCEPVYFGPNDYIFGPVHSNDSIFVSGDGTKASSPSFGSSTSPSAVTTADPNCLFVDDTRGMNGSPSLCADADADVAEYAAQANSSNCAVPGAHSSSCDNPMELPPATDQALEQAAQLDGCLYQGPTQITLDGTQMTVDAPDSAASPATLDSGNPNTCPTDGTAPLPENGVVYVENAAPTSDGVSGANPFDDLVENTATNVTVAGSSTVTLTATVTSASGQLTTGTTVAFSYVSGGTTHPVSGCAAQTLGAPVASGSDYTATATCTLAKPGGTVTSYGATTSAGADVSGSTGDSTTTSPYAPSSSYGPASQVSAGGCEDCYYGETANPDTEADAFVNGHLSGLLTIGTANDVVVDGNLTYDDCATDASGHWATGQSGSNRAQLGLCALNLGPAAVNDGLGLIADNYIEVDHPVNSEGAVLGSCSASGGVLCDPATTDGTCTSSSTGLTIDAALLALSESFVVNNYAAGNGGEGCLTVYGSVQQFARGPVGTFSASSMVSGYEKQYTWDPLLDYESPPSYPVGTNAWTTIGVDASAPSTDACPILSGAFTSIDADGTAQQGAAIVDSCSQGSGRLPDYP